MGLATKSFMPTSKQRCRSVSIAFAVIATIVQFRKVRGMAAAMLVPYFAWILFATFLTYEFRNANPGADGREVSGAVTRIEL